MQCPSPLDKGLSPAWTQDEAIAYECACECITHLMAIHAAEIHIEEGKPDPDKSRLLALSAEQDRLAAERRGLRGTDHQAIARIREEYGTVIRKHGAGAINDGAKETRS